jgi:hypothetical protein
VLPLARFVFTAALGAVAALSWAAAHAATPPDNRFGIYFHGAAVAQLGHTLGVGWQRAAMDIYQSGPGPARYVTNLEAAGFNVVVTYTNVCRTTRPTSCPVTDVAAFKSNLSSDIKASTPKVVVIENEEDAPNFTSATAAQYLQELVYAVEVAHPLHYKVTNGGLTYMGLNLAYWDYLWTSGQHAAADRFALAAFDPSVTLLKDVLGILPNSQNPNRPILGTNAGLKAILAKSQALIVGYHATGIDYINVHWYQAPPAAMDQSIRWLEQQTGLQAVSGETGQYWLSGDIIPGILNETIALGMPYVIWHADDHVGKAIGLATPDGTLQINGKAFESFVSTHQ